MASQTQYVVDVAALHQLHERNYAGLVNLLPDEQAMAVQITVGEFLDFALTIKQQARYTTDVEIVQLPGHWASDYLKTKLEVRLYHDVRMAEVLGSQGVRRLAVHYQQPNQYMRHRDEKHQVNQFLADWLSLCRQRGELRGAATDKFLPHDFK
ncbi:MAG: DUF1249 domain-containing protein [Pseudomonadota bacterium]